jgi:hypothetical protein
MPVIAIVVVIVAVSVTIAMVNVQNVQQQMQLRVLPKVITGTAIIAIATVIQMVQNLSVKQILLQSLLQLRLLLVVKLHQALMVKSVVVVVVTVVAVVVAKMSAMNVVRVLKVIHLIQLQYQQVHLQAHQ